MDLVNRFSKNDPPQIEVKKIVHHKTLPGEFPTPKAVGDYIRSSSPLMRDALVHMDVDPAVVEIAASPNRFEYSSTPYLYGKARQYEHTPALRIKNERGRYVFIDVIPVSIQRSMKFMARRTERLREVLADDYGAGYAVHSEMTLHIQPRHWNLKIMWQVGRNTDDEGRFAVLGFVQQADLPMTLGEIRRHVHLPPPRFRVFDEDGNVVFGHDLDDVDRLFAAVMRLAIEGHLVLDTSIRFSDATAVMWRETLTEKDFLMSQHPNMHAFLVAQQKALLLPDELDLPPHDFSVGEGQRYKLHQGQRYHILNAERDGIAYLELSSWYVDPLRGAVATFLNTASNSHLQVSNQQLAKLEAMGRFRPDGDIPSGAAMTLKAKQMEKANKWLDYVDAIRDRVWQDEPDRIDRPSMKLIDEVAAEKAAERGEEKPHYNTLIKKYRKAECGAYDRAVAVAPKLSPGNTIKKIPTAVTKLLAVAAIEAWRLPSGTWRDARKVFLELLKLPENTFLRAAMFDANGRLEYPSDRHFQRVKAAVPRYMQTYLRYGPERAARVHNVYIKQMRPDLPLEIVDCDFTKLDVVVFDERTMGAFGRPHIIIFRDRCTGSVMGYAVAFDSPSYHLFLAGLRHAMFPKDMSRFPGLPWRQYGRMTAVSFDNELVSDNMTMAAKRVGFQTVEHRPGHPWQKGMMERLIGILNVQTIHNLPGTTMSNPQRRKLFDEDKNLGKPVLTLEELDMFLTVFFCEYNATGHVGLGPISTLEGVPNDLWDKGIAKATQRPPIDPFTLVHLAGDCDRRTIQNVGIRWSNLVYASPELFVLRNNPLHVEGRKGVATTEYLVYRDPNDLSAIWVVDPYTTPNRVVMVPICYEHAKYASGLTLYQHQKYLDEYHKQKRGREPRDIEELLEVQKTFAPALQKMHEERNLHSTAIKLARFFSSIGRKFRHSRIVTAPESAAASAEMIDWEKPFAAMPVASGSSWNAEPHATNPKALVRVGSASLKSDDPVETDLAEWRDAAPAEPTPSTKKYDLGEDWDAWAREYDPSQFNEEGE